ncbi:Tn3 family transposase [Actinomadura nitritigenes]|uniref:Tn3 family transposase n=1 Tax=Actinomadura nitritigenes TaxID=134602 RepID=A0ABS3RE69_9ACTN|nr:Tn3 family transposase [Actinomadura nitritigenes]
MAISIREGRLHPDTMLRRLTSNSCRHEINKTFREVGRSVRTAPYCLTWPIRRCGAG